jgi:peptidoglycan hydrolase-like protein with peptidoglycan-binding domain
VTCGNGRVTAGTALLAAVVLLGACSSGGGADAGPTIATTPSTQRSTTTTTSRSTSSTTTSTTASTTTTTTAPAVEVGNLQAGSNGPRTLALQERLKALKFDPGPVDGKFGPKTTAAVWAFEALAGVARDGVVNPLLEQYIKTAQPAGMLRPDLGPTHAEVDLDRQVLLVFRDGQLQLVTHVSTGSGRHYCDDGRCGVAVTPPGEFHFGRRITGWRDAPLGRLYNPVYFNGGIAVHGAPSVPNTPASHGCVRIPMHIAEYFQGLVVTGEAISVFHGGTGVDAAVPPPAPGATPPAPPDTLAGG